MLRAEVATLKAHQSIVTCFTFTTDRNTLISGGRDGRLAFWNVKDNYKLMSTIKVSDCGIEEDEITAIHYTNLRTGTDNHPFVVIGGLSGALNILDIKS